VFRARLSHPDSREPIDDCLGACFPAPHSYTGEDLVEISTHGGLVVPAAALAALAAAGARPAAPGEFTRRAVLNGKMDLLQAEATADLIDAGSPAQRRHALQQLDRGLSDRLAALRRDILELEALIAYDIDFPEEDEGPVSETAVRRAWCVVRDAVADLLKTAPEGERLREGALLVIAGRPNAGKSSLFNALLGTERAIVTEVPGTTRDVVEGTIAIAGVPVRLLDTAGLETPRDDIEAEGIRRSRLAIEESDLLLVVLDTSVSPDRRVLAETAGRARVLVRAKSDLPSHPEAAALPDAVEVSVLAGVGVDSLLERLAHDIEQRVTDAGDEGGIVTSLRQLELIEALARSLVASADALREMPLEAALVDLRHALRLTGDILGVDVSDAVLDRIFSTFCLGK